MWIHEGFAIGLKQSPGWQHALRYCGTHSEHGLVDDLAEFQMQCDAAEQIGMNIAKAPTVHEQIDHAGSGRAGGSGRIGSRFDDEPRGFEILLGVRSGFDDGPGQWAAFVQVKAQGGLHGALNAIDANLAIPLGGVSIAY